MGTGHAVRPSDGVTLSAGGDVSRYTGGGRPHHGELERWENGTGVGADEKLVLSLRAGYLPDRGEWETESGGFGRRPHPRLVLAAGGRL